MSPSERRTREKPNLKNIKVFDCKAMTHLPWQKRGKLESRAWHGIFVCIERYDTYRVYDPETGKIEIVRNVQFDETVFIGREG
jgi:hypothetical protein